MWKICIVVCVLMYSHIIVMIILKTLPTFIMKRMICGVLSPAYDLTYSNTYYSEHTTTVDGNGKNPGKKELVAVGVQAGMKKTYCERVAEEIRLCVNEKLEHYLK